ncbi:hypothetical protein JS565_12770 [Salmonella enterica subsp. enterica serovar Senftenberg]|nr:hypothetical protein [Salmonella enterica subsp. enterica serovar Senftenberg]
MVYPVSSVITVYPAGAGNTSKWCKSTNCAGLSPLAREHAAGSKLAKAQEGLSRWRGNTARRLNAF